MAKSALDKAREAPGSTKARILAAAEAVFAAKGFQGASTREIAARAGVNISSLHYHWESKETLRPTRARRRHPESAVPPELQATVLEMGQIAERMIAKTGSVIASQDVEMGLELDVDDDQMDRLHRRLFDMLLSPKWKHGVEPAVDITLAGRYFERFADHAVHVAENVVYLVTGQRPEEINDLP